VSNKERLEQQNTGQMAAELKEQGNTLFKEGDFLKAAAAYTKAIKQEPQSHVLYRYGIVMMEELHVAFAPANSTEHHHTT
jgi:tetratricopeptide (TPR) repeat protein